MNAHSAQYECLDENESLLKVTWNGAFTITTRTPNRTEGTCGCESEPENQ